MNLLFSITHLHSKGYNHSDNDDNDGDGNDDNRNNTDDDNDSDDEDDDDKNNETYINFSPSIFFFFFSLPNGNDVLIKIAIVSDDEDESSLTNGNIKADWKKEYTIKTSKLAKCLSASNNSLSPPPSPIPPQLSPVELNRINVKREVRLQLDIQKTMKELKDKISPKKKKQDIDFPKKFFLDLRHCNFDREC